MSRKRKGATAYRYQQLRDALQEPYHSAVMALENAFLPVSHDLWTGDAYNVAETRLEFAQSIRNKHLDDLDDGEIDYLMFKVATTMGGADSLKFFLPRYFAAWFSDPVDGWSTDQHVVKGKLELAKLEEWPSDQKKSALKALYLAAKRDIDAASIERTDPDDDLILILEWAQTRLDAIED